jgi:hypothetical protein
MKRFNQSPRRRDDLVAETLELRTAIVDAFRRDGVPVIFAESNDVITVIVVQTDVYNWGDIASNTRQTFQSDTLG